MIASSKEKKLVLEKRPTINALDPSQKYILEKLTQTHTDDLSLIYGPPGTGKSHLIVSLLFELAYAKKKVLFVSQNREAIDVVIRKYRDLDKEMRIQDTDLSFLDICLHLSDPTQRTLRYIKDLRTRLYKGSGPSVNAQSVDNELPYAIAYRHLDRAENFNLSFDKDSSLGIDELLAYDLEFVGDRKNLAKCSLRRINEIDARGIFSLLREHKKDAEYFKFFCNPTGPLELLSPERGAVVTIGGIQDLVEDISQCFNRIPTIQKVRCISDNDIENVIRYLSVISAVAPGLDVVALKKDGVKFKDAYLSIKEAKKLKAKLIDVKEDLSSISLPEKPIFAGKENERLRKFETSKELFAFRDELQKLKDVIRIETSFGNDATVFDIVSSVLRYNGIDCVAIANDFNLGSFEPSDLARVLNDANDWLALSSLHRVLNKSKKPESIRGLSDDEIGRMHNVYRDNLISIIDMLNGTGYAFKDLVRIQKSSEATLTNSRNLSKKQLIDLVNLALRLENGSLKDLLEKKMSTGWLKERIDAWCAEIDGYETVKNRIASITGAALENDITVINDNISNKNKLEELNSLCEPYKKYYQLGVKNDLMLYFERIGEMSDKAVGFVDIALACYDFSDVTEFDGRIHSLLAELSEKVKAAKESKLFSESFFKVVGGEPLESWGRRIITLLDYNNRAELEYYTGHIDFMSKLGRMLKSTNSLYLSNYIEMGLDYEDFSKHIAYDIIRGLYDNMPASECKNISSVRYFYDFKHNLKKLRAKHYKQALGFMRNDLDGAARRLAQPLNWKDPGGGFMNKMRANTEMITDAYLIIMATPAEVSKYIAPNKEIFDYVIFDEASQLLPGQAIPSIYRAKKAVIVGDPHQMPPTSSIMIGADNSEVEDELDDLGGSILDLVKSFQIDASYHLKVHYRSKYNVLFEPSRQAIYAQDDIRPIFEAKTIKMPLFVRDELGPDENVAYRVIVERVNSYIDKNPDAKFCILFTRKSGKGGSELGFRRFLEESGDSVKNIMQKYSSEDLLISTVTNCQGISGNHTILYIPSYNSPKAMWFFRANAGAYKRLNVAITRQTESLDIVMGDSKALWISACKNMIEDEFSAPDVKLSAELMEGLLLNAGRQIDEQYLEEKLGPNADNIDSPLTEELYEMLSEYLRQKYGGEVRVWCEVGYKIRTPDRESQAANDYNVGYRIDLGVYSRKHKRFILGIEMDGATYHTGFSKEFSDSQRQEILESKGWSIYRIWSTNWLNDKTGEFEALTQIIDEEYQKEPEIEETPINTAQEPIIPQDEDDESGNGVLGIKVQDNGSESSEDGQIEWTLPDEEIAKLDYWNKLQAYLKNHLALGKPVELKFVSNNATDSDIARVLAIMPYQTMVLKNVTEEYIEARFEDSPAHYRIYKNHIVAFRGI